MTTMTRARPGEGSSPPKRRRVRGAIAKRLTGVSRKPALTLFVAISLLSAPGPVWRAEAYRFFAIESAGWIPTSAEARRWLPSKWGPGDTLNWRVSDTALWSHWFGSAEGAVPTIKRALEAWSAIPTADVSWKVGTVASVNEGADTEFVSIDPDSATGGYAWISGRGDRITDCRVFLGSWAAREPPQWWLDLDADDPERLYPALSVFIHEFGHCLGLRHSVELPGIAGLTVRLEFDAERDRYRRVWVHSSEVAARDPQMSYGWSDHGVEYPLARDDIVGASLLRPAGRWERSTGGVTGQVLLDGEPLPFAHVWAFGDGSDRGLPNAVGSFSDADGNFLIEGLSPGVYTLWVSSMIERSAHFDLVGRGSPIDLAETLRPFPVRVSAGGATEGVQVHARRGRDCERPAPCSR